MGRERESYYLIVSSIDVPYCVFEMNRSGAESDKRTAVEVTKDKNGIGQVVLRNPRGASARVRSLYLYFTMYFVFFKSSSSN